MKSPKSKSPVPAIPIPAPETGSTAEGEESGDPVRLLKGHETEVRHVHCLIWLLIQNSKNRQVFVCAWNPVHHDVLTSG